MTIRKTLLAAALAAAACGTHSKEGDAAASAVAERFRALYPNTTVTEVRRAPVEGLYEVVMGDNTAYTDGTGRYFVFGHLYDMASQVDLTAQRRLEARRMEFPSRFLANAIKTVRGNGSRVLAVFADPDCMYCKKLENALARLDDVTLYTFLFPLESLHPEAKVRSIAVWCAADRQEAWTKAVLTGAMPRLAACENPIDDNLVLGTRLGIVGTPTLIALDGRVLPGAVPYETLDRWLSEGKPAKASQ